MRSVSPDTVARIRDMKYKEGKTATDIAAILGISPSAVHNYAPTTEVKGADALEVERRLLAGETQAAIIRTLKTDRPATARQTFLPGDVRSCLHRLEAIGYVRFKADRDGKHKRIRRLAITPAGARSANLPVPTFVETPRIAPRPADLTDFRKHDKVAEGGPIETARVAAKDEPAPSPAAPERFAGNHAVMVTGVRGGHDGAPTEVLVYDPVADAPAAPATVTPAGNWPRLTAATARLDRARRKASLLTDAAALADTDEEREELTRRADAASTPDWLTDDMAEYLAYAAACEGAR
jgi:hypothetical protein